jgi:hypothetical protein
MRAQSAHGEGAVRMHAATGSAAATHSKPGGSRSARARVFFFKQNENIDRRSGMEGS